MALSASTIWEVQTGGNDTSNGGAFDPSQTAGMFSDGASTSSTSATPNFSSVSYSFVSNDIGAWVYIASGTGWNAGWYKITAISGTAATLNAAIGAGVQKTTFVPTTVQGVGATSGATWTIDYSQGANSGAGPAYTFTHLSSTGAGLTVSGGGSGEHTFGKQDVGNCIVITGGTNFNTGRYVIASVAAGVATVVGPSNIHSAAGTNSDGAGSLGGALASIGQLGALYAASHVAFIKSGSYTITSASTNVAAGCFAATVANGAVIGYGTVRNDYASAATFTASGINTATLFSTTGSDVFVAGLTMDGASLTSIKGFSTTSSSTLFFLCTAQNCTNNGLVTTQAATCFFRCRATGCSSQTAARGGRFIYCLADSNTVVGFDTFSGSSVFVGCISAGNSGSSSDGFQVTTAGCVFINCTAYNNGRDGFRDTSLGPNLFLNCIAEGNAAAGANGFNCSTNTAQAVSAFWDACATFNNTTAYTGGGLMQQLRIASVTGTTTFFINAGGGNFALNNTATGGALARATGFPGTFPAGNSVGYTDIGAVQARWPLTPIGVMGVM